MADTDDEALSWAGDEPARAPVAQPVETRYVEAAPAGRPQIPAALLVTYGILVGSYLLYSFGWLSSVLAYNDTHLASPEPVNAFMFGLGEVLAIASPALWFAAALLLTRGRKPLARLLAILVGLLVVLPWPFVLGVW